MANVIGRQWQPRQLEDIPKLEDILKPEDMLK
jgi:hypothetical protein